MSVERRLAYEESARIPLLMRWPKLIKGGSTVDAFALSIDLAPDAPRDRRRPARGGHARALARSAAPRREAAWRDAFLIEYFSDTGHALGEEMGYQAVRTERWKYIHYVDLDGMDELYDLRSRSLRDAEPHPGAVRAGGARAPPGGAGAAHRSYFAIEIAGPVCAGADTVIW